MKYPDAESRRAALDGHDAEVKRAERAVAEAATEYVNHFFPPTETGEGLETPGGKMIRAVRTLKRIKTRQV